MAIEIQAFELPNGPIGPITGYWLLPDGDRSNLPVVFYYHGWSSSSQSQIQYAFELARQGFAVIAPDALYHGRRYPGHQVKLDVFIQVLQTNVQEFDFLIQELEDHLKQQAHFIGVAGMSMGAMTSLLLLSHSKRIDAGVSLMGTPYIGEFINAQLAGKGLDQATQKMVRDQFSLLFDLDLGQHSDLLAGRPLYLWHGEQDPTVPFDHSRKFYEQVSQEEYGQFLYFNYEPAYHQVPYTEILRMGAFMKAASQVDQNDLWSYCQTLMDQQVYEFE